MLFSPIDKVHVFFSSATQVYSKNIHTDGKKCRKTYGILKNSRFLKTLCGDL